MSSPNQLSFLPDDYLERRAQQRTNVIFAVLFLVVGIGLAIAFSIDERSARAIEQQRAEVVQQHTEAIRRIEQVREMQEKQRKMAHQAELTASLLERVPRSFLLADITNSMPAGVSLLDFKLDSKRRMTAAPQPRSAFEQRKSAMEATRTQSGAPIPEPMAFDVSMRMTGMASTDVQVAQFMSTLTRSELLKDVNLLITDQHDLNGVKMRKFQIEMTLNPAADVQAQAAERRGNTRTVMMRD